MKSLYSLLLTLAFQPLSSYSSNTQTHRHINTLPYAAVRMRTDKAILTHKACMWMKGNYYNIC